MFTRFQADEMLRAYQLQRRSGAPMQTRSEAARTLYQRRYDACTEQRRDEAAMAPVKAAAKARADRLDEWRLAIRKEHDRRQMVSRCVLAVTILAVVAALFAVRFW